MESQEPEKKQKFEEQWIQYQGAWTQVISLKREDPTYSIVLISGNPGVARFYSVFAEEIFKLCHCEIHVLSHSGMVSSVPPKKASIEKSKVLFHSQMKQKHYIIDQLGLYEHPKLVLMGHSIGARMMLDCIHENTLLAIGLTPTIERMSITPRGKDLTPHFNSSISMFFVQVFFFILSILPRHVLLKSIKKARPTSAEMISDVIVDDMCSVTAIWSCTTMACDEMKQVVKRPDHRLEKWRGRLKFLYSQTDDWVPMSYYLDMKRDFPEIPQLLPETIPHAFVENHDQAKYVAKKCVLLVKQADKTPQMR